MAIEIKSYPQHDTGKVTLAATFDPTTAMIQSMATALLADIVHQIAERWVAENYQMVAAAIKPEAVATIACAEAGAAINKTLKENIPARVMEVVKKEVWQRGLFGGMTRVG